MTVVQQTVETCDRGWSPGAAQDRDTRTTEDPWGGHTGLGGRMPPRGPRVPPLPRGSKVLQEEEMHKPEAKRVEEVNEVVVLGNVSLTEDKVNLLNLGPKFMVVSKLSSQEMTVESVATMTKIRWGRRSKGQEDLTDHEAMWRTWRRTWRSRRLQTYGGGGQGHHVERRY